MNDIVKYNYSTDGKELYIEILMKDINVQNSLELKNKLNSLKLARVKSATVDMLAVNNIDKHGIEILTFYKKQLGSFGIKMIYDNCRVM